MLRSISSRTRLAFLSLFFACALPSAADAQDAIDDRAIKEAFKSKLSSFLDAAVVPPASELRSQLSREPTFKGALEARQEVNELTPSSVYSQAKKATVIVGHLYLCDKCDQWHSGLAGGVIVSEDGLVLTNYHVLDVDRSAIFGAMTDNGEVFPVAKIMAASKANDVSLIKLSGASGLSSASIAEPPMIGDDVFVVSHPDSHFFTLTSGRVSRFSIEPEQRTKRMEITAEFARGSSGSGVFDRYGHLVGLVAATNSIYYNQDAKTQKNLQMVIETCVPLSAIEALFEASPPRP
tara:strand:- start:4950 stop:5828 length:879 start_codon:yes stop_codon:yes gene_type:complete